MVNIIDGQALAEKIKDEVVEAITAMVKTPHAPLLQGGLIGLPRPNLAIILVGGREDSELYVSLKEKEAKKVGIDTHLYKCDENISEKELLEVIKYLNDDSSVDAILLQLPLPKNLDTDKIVAAINPQKDVDGFHPDNLKVLLNTCNNDGVMPPVFDVVLEILKSIKYDLQDERVCILANSDIFGQGLKKVLECKGAKAEVANPDDQKIKTKTSQADLLITAVGRANFVKEDMVKNGAIVIDIGITKKDKKVFGDVDFKEVSQKASFITPVPGGVGPMTIAMAFKNTVKMFKRRKGGK